MPSAFDVVLPAMSPPGVRSEVSLDHDDGFVRIMVQHVRPDEMIGGDLVDGVQAVLAPVVALQLARALIDVAEIAGGARNT